MWDTARDDDRSLPTVIPDNFLRSNIPCIHRVLSFAGKDPAWLARAAHVNSTFQESVHHFGEFLWCSAAARDQIGANAVYSAACRNGFTGLCDAVVRGASGFVEVENGMLEAVRHGRSEILDLFHPEMRAFDMAFDDNSAMTFAISGDADWDVREAMTMWPSCSSTASAASTAPPSPAAATAAAAAAASVRGTSDNKNEQQPQQKRKSENNSNMWRKRAYDTVERLINAGMPINKAPCGGLYRPPLHAAIRAHRLDIAQLLLEYGADIEFQSTSGRHEHQTPLTEALTCTPHRCTAVEFVLNCGAEFDHDFSTKEGSNIPLHRAVELRCEACVTRLLDLGANVYATCTKTGLNAIGCAIMNKDPEFVDLLLTKGGADQNALAAFGGGGGGARGGVAMNGGRSQRRSVRQGQRGADDDDDDDDDDYGDGDASAATSKTAFSLKSFFRTGKLVSELFLALQQHNSINNGLLRLSLSSPTLAAASAISTQRGSNKSHTCLGVDTLLKFDADVNCEHPNSTSDQRGATALHYAIQQGTTCCVYSLLKAGASVHARTTKSGLTPLMMAVMADSSSSFSNNTGIAAAAAANSSNSKHSCTVVDLLIEYGADVQVLDLKGICGNLIHLAVMCSGASPCKKCISRFVALGVDVDARVASSKQTPLHLAMNQSRWETARHLLSLGANPSLTCTKNRDALYYAVRARRPELVQMLLEFGASRDSVRRAHTTAQNTGFGEVTEKLRLILSKSDLVSSHSRDRSSSISSTSPSSASSSSPSSPCGAASPLSTTSTASPTTFSPKLTTPLGGGAPAASPLGLRGKLTSF